MILLNWTTEDGVKIIHNMPVAWGDEPVAVNIRMPNLYSLRADAMVDNPVMCAPGTKIILEFTHAPDPHDEP